MLMRLPGICLIVIILAASYGIHRLQHLQERLDTLERTLLINQATDFKQQLLDRYITPQENGIAEMRCTNGESKWVAGAGLLRKSRVVTTQHLLKPKTECDVFSQNKLIGKFKEQQNQVQKIGSANVVIASIELNDNGKLVTPLTPRFDHQMNTGDLVIMLAYLNTPQHLIHFGMVLAPLDNMQHPEWSDALITNDSPTLVPDGSPFFAPNGDFSGIYLGKHQEFLYHYIFDGEFLVYYYLTGF